jgi:hypothetical protein
MAKPSPLKLAPSLAASPVVRRELVAVLDELVGRVERSEMRGLIAISIDRDGVATVETVNVDDASACWILETHVLKRRLRRLEVI